MKIILLGSMGMLGRAIANTLASDSAINVVGIDRLEAVNEICSENIVINLLDFDNVSRVIRQMDADVIINTAAIVDLAFCEDNKPLAINLHVGLNEVLASCCQRIIYISTDSVFNGTCGNYLENDNPDPLNYYAYSKLCGENVINKNKNNLVIRTNIYGFKYPKGDSLFEWLLDNLTSGKSIVGYKNVIFNPVSIYQLAGAISIVLRKGITGTINIAAENVISKFDFARKTAMLLGVDPLLVREGVMEVTKSSIRRPLNTSLNTTYMKSILGTHFLLADGMQDTYQKYLRKKN